MGGRNGTFDQEYCVPVPGSETDSDGPIYRNPEYVNNLMFFDAEGHRTLYE